MSGTTAIVVAFPSPGTELYCANVGDSRAIVAERRGGALHARALSSDQVTRRYTSTRAMRRCDTGCSHALFTLLARRRSEATSTRGSRRSAPTAS